MKTTQTNAILRNPDRPVTNNLQPDELSRIAIFRDIDLAPLADDIVEIMKLALPAGHTLLSPNQKNENIYALLEGELSVSLQPDGHAINHIVAGECVGEISIIDDQPPSAWVRTATPCTVIAIHSRVLTRMFEKQPKLAVNLLKLLSQRFRHSNQALSESLSLQQEYRNKAERDALTGLHNRVWMDEVFTSQLELSHRIGQSVCMMILDADHFKQVNDLHGHSAGDDALRHLARLIATQLRETDLLVRYGGEEFVTLLPGTDAQQAQQLAEKVRSAIPANPLQLANGMQLKLTLSIGLTVAREGEHLHNLIDRADKALYKSKGNGRNQVTLG